MIFDKLSDIGFFYREDGEVKRNEDNELYIESLILGEERNLKIPETQIGRFTEGDIVEIQTLPQWTRTFRLGVARVNISNSK